MSTDVIAALAGFIVGSAAGWFARALVTTRALAKHAADKVDQIADHLDHLDRNTTSSTESEPMPKPRDERGYARADVLRDIIIVAMLAVVIYTTVLSWRASHRLTDITECQAAYNEASSQVSQQRATWAEQDRRALKELVDSIVTANDEPTVITALADYQKITGKNAENRRESPLPNNNCGTP